jgi:dihydrofolate synthase/folylpolyglutamate synthase
LEFKKIFYHSLNTERAATYEEVLTWLPEADLFPADPHSRDVFFNEFKSELVIFAGSFYFYPTVRDWLASFTFNR